MIIRNVSLVSLFSGGGGVGLLQARGEVTYFEWMMKHWHLLCRLTSCEDLLPKLSKKCTNYQIKYGINVTLFQNYTQHSRN